MSKQTADSTDIAKTTSGADDALRKLKLQFQIVENECETAKSRLLALRNRVEDEGQAALAEAMTVDPTIADAVNAIGANPLDTTDHELGDIVAESPDTVNEEERIERLSDTTERLSELHDRLLDLMTKLTELQETEPFSHREVQVAIDDAVAQIDEIKSMARRAQRLTDEVTPEFPTVTDEQYVVTGMVTQNDEALSNVIVRVFDRDLSSVEELGETTTDERGRYQVSYERADFERAEHDSADLLVTVFDEGERRIGRSEVVYNAGSSAVVNLHFDAGQRVTPTEYTRLRQELDSLLGNETLHRLPDDDIAFLRSELQVEGRDVYPAGSETIDHLVAASVLADETTFDERLGYALARQGQELSREALFTATAQTLVSSDGHRAGNHRR
jgi:hypothetical protein